MEIPFSEEEVLATLSSLSGDKTPGPNGFSMAFWQFCWVVVKKEVIGFFFFRNSMILGPFKGDAQILLFFGTHTHSTFLGTRRDSFSILGRILPFPGTRPDSTIFRYSH